jgi:hypothetical protein
MFPHLTAPRHVARRATRTTIGGRSRMRRRRLRRLSAGRQRRRMECAMSRLAGAACTRPATAKAGSAVFVWRRALLPEGEVRPVERSVVSFTTSWRHVFAQALSSSKRTCTGRWWGRTRGSSRPERLSCRRRRPERRSCRRWAPTADIRLRRRPALESRNPTVTRGDTPRRVTLVSRDGAERAGTDESLCAAAGGFADSMEAHGPPWLALQAGGHRFDPGTLHLEESSKQHRSGGQDPWCPRKTRIMSRTQVHVPDETTRRRALDRELLREGP